MENMGEDMTRVGGWWKNRMARVLLVFLFSSIGSSIGTIVAFGWLKDLL
jgi:pheromone shutdown protein TraB